MMELIQGLICSCEICIPFFLGGKWNEKRKMYPGMLVLWYIFVGVSIGLLVLQRHFVMYSRLYVLFEIGVSFLLCIYRFRVKWRDVFLFLSIFYESIYVLDLFFVILYDYIFDDQSYTWLLYTVDIRRIVIYLISRGLVLIILFIIYRNRNKMIDIYNQKWKLFCIIPIIEYISLIQCDIIFTRKEESITVRSFLIFLFIYMCLTFSIIIMFIYLKGKNDRLFLEEKAMMLEEKNKKALIFYNERNILIHDIENHFIVLVGILKRDGADRALAYISDIRKSCLDINKKIDTGNIVVDTLIEEKINRAIEHNIRIKIISDDISDSFINDRDWCSILANLLDNAIEACKKVEGKRKIDVRIENRSFGIMLYMENSCSELMIGNNGRLITSKKNIGEHGIGLQSINYALEKYEGKIVYEYKNDFFRVNVALYK